MGRWVGAVVAALVTSSIVVVASPASAAKPLVTVDEPTVRLSPDGDGRQDTATVRFRLGRAAAVVVTIGGAGRKEAVSLGTLDAGAHRWSWNGRIDGRVPDGRYTVRIKARRDGRSDEVEVRAVVDTVRDHGVLVTSRSTVYPKATAVVDHALVTYLRESWSPQAEADGRLGLPLRVSFAVAAPDGRVVQRGAHEASGVVSLDWYGRGAGGEPLPEGRYVVRVRVLDPAGNLTRLTQSLDLSHRQLRKEVVTTTVAAAAATTWHPSYPVSCLGCGEWCSPVPSPRYAGGLSFDSSCGWGSTVGFFSWAAPFAAAPVDDYRVTAVGGPPTPGGTGVLSLSGSATLGPGDDTVTSSWNPVALERAPYLPDGSVPATWTASTGLDGAYDLASFTIEYRHWVPVEG